MSLHILLVTLLWMGTLAPATPAADPMSPRDVLFIVVDDLNDWISLLEFEAPIQTPNLQRLSERGTLFTKAYCVSAACNPSRVATLTGLRPSTTDARLRHLQTTLPVLCTGKVSRTLPRHQSSATIARRLVRFARGGKKIDG